MKTVDSHDLFNSDMPHLVALNKDEIINGKSTPVSVGKIKDWLALYNCNVYWVVPKHGSDIKEIPNDTQFLLMQKEDNTYIAVFPLIDGDLKASLCGTEDGIVVKTKGAISGTEPANAVMLYVANGKNPYTLVKESVKVISKTLKSFKIREDKKTPEFTDYLGWCTWDAFYGSVDEEKVIMGLDSFKDSGFPLGFMILDDGSWDTYYDSLNAIQVNPHKFSNGLHGLIDNAKSNYGIKIFGVWHCFEGYWGGIKPDGALSEKYKLIKNHVNIRPWEEVETKQDISFVDPDEIMDFYRDFHSYLYNEGADMLKIDGQCAMDLFTNGKVGAGTAMKKYQQAMQSSGAMFFDNRIIHCMSNSVDVAYNMMSTNCWRNSYDYAPKNFRMQQEHIYINAMNALWTSTFSIPDWDMFQSHSSGAEIHAASRSISGGPVYVCDYPGKQNFDILNKLITSDGKILKCDQPALPTEDCIFADVYTDDRLLKIFNRCKKNGVIGLFNCNIDNKIIKDNFCANDIQGIEGEVFAVYFNRTGKLFIVGLNDQLTAEINSNEYELVSFSPVENDITVIGLVDKYNNTAAIISTEWIDNRYVVKICEGGKTVFYSKNKPLKVLLNNQEVEFEYNELNGLLIINAKYNGTNTFVFTL